MFLLQLLGSDVHLLSIIVDITLAFNLTTSLLAFTKIPVDLIEDYYHNRQVEARVVKTLSLNN